MLQISIEEAKQSFPVLINEDISGEEVIITKDYEPILKLISILKSNIKPQFGSAKGLITMSEDFDEPLEDFKDYM